MSLELKYCKECKDNLSISLFTKNKLSKDGLYSFCKKCTNKKVRERYNNIINNFVSKRTKYSNHYRKYQLNEGFFDKLSEHQIYWIGFLLADGCLANRKASLAQRLMIGLSAIDTEHLLKFASDLETNRPISNPDKQNIVHFEVSSKKISTELKKYGITPNKSKIATTDLSLYPNELLRHLFRGYIDGDGCIHKGKNFWSVSAVGSEDFLNKMSLHFHTKLGVRYNKPNYMKKNHIWQVGWGGSHVIDKILNYLYKDSTIFLNRKYELYKQFIEEYRKAYGKDGSGSEILEAS